MPEFDLRVIGLEIEGDAQTHSGTRIVTKHRHNMKHSPLSLTAWRTRLHMTFAIAQACAVVSETVNNVPLIMRLSTSPSELA